MTKRECTLKASSGTKTQVFNAQPDYYTVKRKITTCKGTTITTKHFYKDIENQINWCIKSDKN